MSRSQRTLSLRQWLILAVVAIFVVSALVEVVLSVIIYHAGAEAAYHNPAQVNAAQLAKVRRAIGTDPAAWRRSDWQQRTTSRLSMLDVDAALFTGAPGHRVFATPGARHLLATSSLAPAGPSQASPAAEQASGLTGLPLFARLTIAGPPGTVPPAGIAFVWFTRPQPGPPWILVLYPIAGVLTVTLTLGAIAVLMRGPLLRPLAAMSDAAQDIAGGDLDVHLPSSPVREIAEVTTAVEGMSHALGEALAQQTALEAERRLFVGAIAHDLRTPLFILRAHLRGLQKGIATTPEKVREYIDEASARADALERLIADLFAFTRLEYLEQAPDRAPLELGALLSKTVDSVRLLAAAKRVVFALRGPDEPCALLGDSHLLTRVAENLLDNAIRHSPLAGEVRVAWGRTGNSLWFTVADTGLGIADPDLPHLFTPLYRGEASRNSETGGTGLGLAIAMRILRAHGGALVAGNNPAGGAIFTATLPMSIPRAADGPRPMSAPG